MAVLGTYIYPSIEGPAYKRGFAINCGFVSASLFPFYNRGSSAYQNPKHRHGGASS